MAAFKSESLAGFIGSRIQNDPIDAIVAALSRS
jgi:hypothetical protein